MRGRGVVEELFLDGVLVDPAIVRSRRVTVARACALASSSRVNISMSARRAANKERERERAPGGELARSRV